jgi:hypothetical protein
VGVSAAGESSYAGVVPFVLCPAVAVLFVAVPFVSPALLPAPDPAVALVVAFTSVTVPESGVSVVVDRFVPVTFPPSMVAFVPF